MTCQINDSSTVFSESSEDPGVAPPPESDLLLFPSVADRPEMGGSDTPWSWHMMKYGRCLSRKLSNSPSVVLLKVYTSFSKCSLLLLESRCCRIDSRVTRYLYRFWEFEIGWDGTLSCLCAINPVNLRITVKLELDNGQTYNRKKQLWIDNPSSLDLPESFPQWQQRGESAIRLQAIRTLLVRFPLIVLQLHKDSLPSISTAAPSVAAEVIACLTKVSPSTRNSSEPAKSPCMSIQIEGMLEYHDVSSCNPSSLPPVGAPSSSGELVEAILIGSWVVASLGAMQRGWSKGVKMSNTAFVIYEWYLNEGEGCF